MRLADIDKREQLELALGTPLELLDEYANAGYQAQYYEEKHIAKRGKNRKGEYRVVFAANDAWLAKAHKNIASLVNLAAQPVRECVTGFTPKRSIRHNAAPHCGAKLLLHADLKDFFDTITIDQVREAFRYLGAKAEMAPLFARLSTIDGLLRQGTRCSPAIANVAARDLDTALLAVAAAVGATYTRYADNLTFSGDRVPAEQDVVAAITAARFVLRGHCSIQQRGRRQYVTGLSIADTAPRLPRRMKRRLRLVLHYVEKYGVDDHLARAKQAYPETEDGIRGLLKFALPIERPLIRRLEAKFDTGVAKSEAQRDAEDMEYEPDPPQY